MSDAKDDGRAAELVLEFRVDAPVEKVWRAIDAPDLREKWLPGCVPADAEPHPSPSPREARFTMRDDEPPFVETIVTLRVLPRVEGGSILRITHDVPAFGTSGQVPRAANADGPPLMRAA